MIRAFNEGCANDSKIFFETVEDPQKTIIFVDQIFEKSNLHINVSISKRITFNFNYYSENPDHKRDSVASLNGKPIKNMKICKYLGNTIKYDE